MRKSNKNSMSLAAKGIKAVMVSCLLFLLMMAVPKQSNAQATVVPDASIEYDNVYYSYDYPPYDFTNYYITGDVYIVLTYEGEDYTPPVGYPLYVEFQEYRAGTGSYTVTHGTYVTDARTLWGGSYELATQDYYLSLNVVTSPTGDYNVGASNSY